MHHMIHSNNDVVQFIYTPAYYVVLALSWWSFLSLCWCSFLASSSWAVFLHVSCIRLIKHYVLILTTRANGWLFIHYCHSWSSWYSAILNIDKPELEPMGPSRGGTGHNFWTWAAPFMYYQAAGTAPAPGFCIAGSILNIALWARALVCSSRSSMT